MAVEYTAAPSCAHKLVCLPLCGLGPLVELTPPRPPPTGHGTWQFTYSTDPEFEDWALRRKIAVEYLGWQFTEEENGADLAAPPKSLRRNV